MRIMAELLSKCADNDADNKNNHKDKHINNHKYKHSNKYKYKEDHKDNFLKSLWTMFFGLWSILRISHTQDFP